MKLRNFRIYLGVCLLGFVCATSTSFAEDNEALVRAMEHKILTLSLKSAIMNNAVPAEDVATVTKMLVKEKRLRFDSLNWFLAWIAGLSSKEQFRKMGEALVVESKNALTKKEQAALITTYTNLAREKGIDVEQVAASMTEAIPDVNEHNDKLWDKRMKGGTSKIVETLNDEVGEDDPPVSK